jgi:hypothetical protein
VLIAGQGSEGAMFLRIVRAAGGKGVKHEYLRVVEAYREGGKTRHRTVLNLGRKDQCVVSNAHHASEVIDGIRSLSRRILVDEHGSM